MELLKVADFLRTPYITLQNILDSGYTVELAKESIELLASSANGIGYLGFTPDQLKSFSDIPTDILNRSNEAIWDQSSIELLASSEDPTLIMDDWQEIGAYNTHRESPVTENKALSKALLYFATNPSSKPQMPIQEEINFDHGNGLTKIHHAKGLEMLKAVNFYLLEWASYRADATQHWIEPVKMGLDRLVTIAKWDRHADTICKNVPELFEIYRKGARNRKETEEQYNSLIH